MVDRLELITVLLVPDARPSVQPRNVVGPLVEQVRLQHIRKQLVIAIPLAAIIQRNQK
jgi:hypothetical protein